MALLSSSLLMNAQSVWANFSSKNVHLYSSKIAISADLAEVIAEDFAQNSANNKVISNVRVFPNPTVESISLSFKMNKRADVNIKIMDALGSELVTLMNQTLDAGIQNHSFDIQKKLASGVYFLRITSSSETIVKRISVIN